MFHFYLDPIADSYLVVGLAALVLVSLMAFRPPASKTARGRRFILALLRLLVIALLIAAMLRPTLVYTETKRQPATLILLLDKSRSMSVPDAMSGKSRWDALRSELAKAASEIDNLPEEFEVKAYAFDGEAHEAEVKRGQVRLPETPDGAETAIGSVLEDVLRRQAGKRLLGVVLMSDGAQRAYAPRDTAPQAAASRLKQLGYHLYAFPFGQSRQGKDVGIQDLVCNEQVFIKNRLEVSGQIRIDGFANRDIPVQLKVESAPGKSEVVDRTTVHATGDNQLLAYKFHYVPQVPGECKLTVEAAQQPGERVLTNNQMSTYVNVLKGGVNVLYCEGNLRVEQKFLRRSLDASPDIKVEFRRIDPDQPGTRPPDFSDYFKPGKFDVYILGDIDSAAFTRPQLEDLAQAVQQGAGLLMLGGYQSFGAGGYATTPLKDVLPVEMSPLDRQDRGRAIRADLHAPGPLKMRPTDVGLRHFAMMLDNSPVENNALWEKLPPLEGSNRFNGTKPAALVLAAAGSTPLLVAQPYGNGRTMAFGADSTWRWWMRGFEKVHKRFWRQMVLWLARKDQAAEGNVWIRFQQRRLMPNQRAEITVGAQSPTGEPLGELSGEVEVTLPDGSKQPIPLGRQEDLLAGSFRDTQAPGDYLVQATVRSKDKVLGTARAHFLVSQQDLELDNASADVALMTNLATMTGGEQLAPERLGDLIHRLGRNVEHLTVQQETKKTFWDTWPFFLAFVGLLALQWFLRKRWGLV